MIERTEAYIREEELFEKGEKIILALSGGADSVCLLEILSALAADWDFHLTAVHVHHGIRGETADGDADFVKELCEEKKIPLHLHRVNVPQMVKELACGEEETGRILRREIFEKELEAAEGGKIALAHHANDNAETLLMNLCRGSGIRGMGGIYPKRGAYVRPLLWAGRKEIQDFLKARGIAWREDETNRDPAYTRNKIRLEILPLLEEVNERAIEHFARLAEESRQLAFLIDEETERLAKEYWREEKEGLRIDEKVLTEKEFLVDAFLKNCLIQVAGRAKDIERRHVEALGDLLRGESGRKRDLPYGMTAEKTYGALILRREARESQTAGAGLGTGTGQTAGTEQEAGPERETRSDCGSGENEADSKVNGKPAPFEAEKRILKNEKFSFDKHDNYTKYFDYDIIGERSFFRSRQAGDYLVIDAAGHRQKVKDWMIDHKIERSERDRIMLLADGPHVYWIVGYRQAEDCLVTEKTEKIIEWRVRNESRSNTHINH